MEAVEEIKRLLEDMQKSEVFKSRKEVVIDAVKEMAVRYGLYSKETARDILNKRISGKLSDTVRAVREG
jgi:hypothetical protein